ncbi:DUF6350 family protein [Actinocatenispora thailandica]|nr:DUF6350 family protein [Actinocatenispora thailandica]
MSVTEPSTAPAEDSPPAPATTTPDAAPLGRASVFVAAAATAGWAALVSFVPLLVLVLLGWLVAGGAGAATSALRVAGAAWLLGNGVPIHTPIGPYGLVPLALTAFIGWRLVRAGGNTARALGDRRAALLGAVGVAVGYGLLAALLALLVSGPEVSVPVPRAFLTAGGFALVCAVVGVAHRSGMLRHIGGQLSPAVRLGLRSGAFAAVTLLGLGAFTAGGSLAWHADRAADTFRAYQAGPVGDIGLTLLCLLYAPTVSVWAVAYLSGPGFAFGAHTAVGIGGVHLGPVPAIPLLAALPTSAAPATGALLLGLPLLVGVATGWLAARRDTGPGLTPLLLATALSGAVAGALFAVAGALSAGSLGGGRLATIGPSWWQLGLAVAGLIGLAAMAAGLTARTIARVRPRPAPTGSTNLGPTATATATAETDGPAAGTSGLGDGSVAAGAAGEAGEAGEAGGSGAGGAAGGSGAVAPARGGTASAAGSEEQADPVQDPAAEPAAGRQHPADRPGDETGAGPAT